MSDAKEGLELLMAMIQKSHPATCRLIFNRGYAAAREDAAKVKPCKRCDGSGKVEHPCPDSQCGDSTWDHYCELGGYDPCPKCGGKSHAERIRAMKPHDAQDEGREVEEDEDCPDCGWCKSVCKGSCNGPSWYPESDSPSTANSE